MFFANLRMLVNWGFLQQFSSKIMVKNGKFCAFFKCAMMSRKWRPDMKILKLFFAVVVSMLVYLPMATAQTNRPSTEDAAVFRQIISSQIAAFQKDDADGAYAFAAPRIKKSIGDARLFMQMVERKYLPVFRPLRFKFTETKMIGKIPVQTLSVDGPQGKQWTAFYLFEQQGDKSWRISGVFLKKKKGIGI